MNFKERNANKFPYKNAFTCAPVLKAMLHDNNKQNTPGTAEPGGRDRTLAVRSRKNGKKSAFFRKKIKITQFFFAYIF